MPGSWSSEDLAQAIEGLLWDLAERKRFASENAQLTGRSLQGGRLMALMFPTVMLIQNG